jgi:hypothetical protein
MMKSLTLPFAAVALLLLCGCGQKQPSPASPVEVPPAIPSRPAPAAPKADRPAASLPEEPFSPTSAQGAATVVETYFALIEAQKYREALALRWDAGHLGLDRFKAHFAPYADYHATVGAPSQMQGAAGSLYVEVPVHVYGTLRSGKPFGSVGNITLRRVNGVPGATAQEKRWRIYTGG